MAFELNKLALRETTELLLRHPVTEEVLYADDDESLPVTIIIYGTSSKQYRNALTSMQNRQLKRGKKTASAEQMREEGIELLVACSDKVLNMTYNGKVVDNDDVFRSLYSDPAYSWVKDAVDAELGNTAAFMKE